ncbi:MAG: hypothetical protein ACRDK7_05370 [Solirubrobacteraceae bacterium]
MATQYARRVAAARKKAEIGSGRASSRRGEAAAIAHFQRRGFRLLGRKRPRHSGEPDLALFDGHTLVFAKVKAVRAGKNPGKAWGYDEQAHGWPTGQQHGQMHEAAIAWLTQAGPGWPTARERRIDLIKAVFDAHDELIDVIHIEGSWRGSTRADLRRRRASPAPTAKPSGHRLSVVSAEPNGKPPTVTGAHQQQVGPQGPARASVPAEPARQSRP